MSAPRPQSTDRARRQPLTAPWLCAVALLLTLLPCAQAETAAREYQVKAAFLFNFLQFVEWPAEAFTAEAAPIRIGILGDDPFGPMLEETVRGETIRQRPLEVRRGRRIDDLGGCHLLFISRSEQGRVGGILQEVGQAPVLTVSDLDGFADRGGGIRLFLVGKKVRFEINAEAVQKQRLKVSSQLLSLGKPAGSTRAGEDP